MNKRLFRKLCKKRGEEYEVLFTNLGSQARYRAIVSYGGIDEDNVVHFFNEDYDDPHLYIELKRIIFIKLL